MKKSYKQETSYDLHSLSSNNVRHPNNVRTREYLIRQPL